MKRKLLVLGICLLSTSLFFSGCVTKTVQTTPGRRTGPPPPQSRIITDGINDVCSENWYNMGIVYTSHPDIDVQNIDIKEVTYNHVGKQIAVTFQVVGSIENRGIVADFLNNGNPDWKPVNLVFYDFTISTSEQMYDVFYINHTCQMIKGWGNATDLISLDFNVTGDTLTFTFPLISAEETVENMRVESHFMKENYTASEEDFDQNVQLIDIAPSLPLDIPFWDAPTVGYVGDSLQFNGTAWVETGQPPYSYHWDFGDGVTSTQQNPIHIYTEPGNFTYNFTVTDQLNSTVSVREIIRINLKPIPYIICTFDSNTNRINIAQADLFTKWSDIEITTGNHAAVWHVYSSVDLQKNTDNITTYVAPGDYIQISGVTGNTRVTLRYIPTNLLLGTWIMNV